MCRADLSRVQGLGVVFCEMLEDLGVGDVRTLAEQQPVRLHERLRQQNNLTRMAGRAPSIDEVTDWVGQSTRLPKLVTHPTTEHSDLAMSIRI